MQTEKTCKEFLNDCTFDGTWRVADDYGLDNSKTTVSVTEMIASPEVGDYYEKQNVVVFKTEDGDLHIITDPENVDVQYPVDFED